jgi:hypothetical protein
MSNLALQLIVYNSLPHKHVDVVDSIQTTIGSLAKAIIKKSDSESLAYL